jgi:hypothetical protein
VSVAGSSSTATAPVPFPAAALPTSFLGTCVPTTSCVQLTLREGAQTDRPHSPATGPRFPHPGRAGPQCLYGALRGPSATHPGQPAYGDTPAPGTSTHRGSTLATPMGVPSRGILALPHTRVCSELCTVLPAPARVSSSAPAITPSGIGRWGRDRTRGMIIPVIFLLTCTAVHA